MASEFGQGGFLALYLTLARRRVNGSTLPQQSSLTATKNFNQNFTKSGNRGNILESHNKFIFEDLNL